VAVANLGGEFEEAIGSAGAGPGDDRRGEGGGDGRELVHSTPRDESRQCGIVWIIAVQNNFELPLSVLLAGAPNVPIAYSAPTTSFVEPPYHLVRSLNLIFKLRTSNVEPN
jgi:hypothetical protein